MTTTTPDDLVVRLRAHSVPSSREYLLNSPHTVSLLIEAADALKAARCHADLWRKIGSEGAARYWKDRWRDDYDRAERMTEAVKFAHAQGFEWPTDPFAALTPVKDADHVG